MYNLYKEDDKVHLIFDDYDDAVEEIMKDETNDSYIEYLIDNVGFIAFIDNKGYLKTRSLP